MDARAWTITGLTCATLAGVAYVAYPCVTLYRLDEAVSRGDARALQTLIDWPDVRQGIEADLASGDSDLPPFGAGFLRTVAVKAAMTPENVMAALHAVDRDNGGAASVWPRAVWVEGPCTAVVDLGTVRLRLQLRAGEWRVTRAWLPETVLTQARAIARR